MANKKRIYVIQHNHFDPIWRRGWLRAFDYQGKRYRPYSELEKMVFDIWVENAKRGATFSEGQAVVVRQYVRNNPEALPVLIDLVRRGIFELTAAGETVADTNMPSGETLLRNLVMGQLWFYDTFGVVPSCGWLEDAFGQSAQIPQIFRGCEVRHVNRLSYKRVPGQYWRGLDGSVIFTADAPYEAWCGSFYKIPPCSACNGMGCESCMNTGFENTGRITDDMVRSALSGQFDGEPFSMLIVGGEESIPNPNLPELVVEANNSNSEYEFYFGTYADLEREFADLINKVDNPDLEISDQVEANPVSTGCYVTRIRIKQEFRAIEHLLTAAEKWATIAWLQGVDYPSDALDAAWRDLLFTAFHDAITSTHIDSAYFELMDMFAQARKNVGVILDTALTNLAARTPGDTARLVVFNSESWEREDLVQVRIPWANGAIALRDMDSGEAVEILESVSVDEGALIVFRSPSVPALGYRTIAIESVECSPSSIHEEIGPGQIENDFFRIEANDRGLVSIFDKRLERNVALSSSYLPNELVLEEDIGHPWGTQKTPEREEPLSRYTNNVSITHFDGFSEIRVTGKYAGNDTNVKKLNWVQATRLYKGIPRVDFITSIDWDTAQRRIRLAFPTPIRTSEAVYAIPYGAIKRGPYEPELNILPSTNGDWPAVNWIDISDGNWGIGILNTGTPSHRVVDGTVFMSILRSPTDSWCLNEPEYYDCPDFDGARDSGHHEFRYAIVSHSGDWRTGKMEQLGREFNAPLIGWIVSGRGDASLPAVHSFAKLSATPNVVVSAIKKAYRDSSVIVRLAETNGMVGKASITIEGAGQPIATTNFLERLDQSMVDETISLSPFKILTVRFEGKIGGSQQR